MSNQWRQIRLWAREGHDTQPEKVTKTEDEWRALLDAETFRVTRQHGTERPFSSEMCQVFEPGMYACSCCKTPLFDSSSKFDSGTGWPSFSAPLTDHLVAYHMDNSFGMTRIEAICNVCNAHLGHVFPDGPPPTGVRYCINAVALKKLSSQDKTKA